MYNRRDKPKHPNFNDRARQRWYATYRSARLQRHFGKYQVTRQAIIDWAKADVLSQT